jgi:hypothetical protein
MAECSKKYVYSNFYVGIKQVLFKIGSLFCLTGNRRPNAQPNALAALRLTPYVGWFNSL